MTEPKPKVVHFSEVPAQPVGADHPGASIRWLIDDEHDGAPYYALRMIELEPGATSPHHAHPFEHENFVVEGVGRVFYDDVWHDLKVGDVAFVPANTVHQYANAGDKTFRFLCGIPVKKFLPQ